MRGLLRRKSPWAALGILLLTAGVYFNSLDNSFHYDDTHSILENPHLRRLSQIPRFFVDPRTFSREPGMAMYRPMLSASYALNYAFGRYRPWGYHLVNLGVHGLVALMVFALLKEILGNGKWAWWGGAIFALHPIHSQVVNYVSSRSESLAALGVLVAFFLVARRRPRKIGASVAYSLGLLSKSTAVALLPLLALCTWWQRAGRRAWKVHLPFWGITALYVGVIAANQFLIRSLSQEVRPYSEQLMTQLKALVYYGRLLFVPVGLSVEHDFFPSQSLREGAVLGSLFLVSSLVYLAWQGRRANLWGALGLGWFLSGLGLTFLIPLNMLINEHRLYLPFVGALIAVLGPLSARRAGTALKGVGGTLLLCLGILTSQRNAVWRDELTLWQEAAARAPNLFRVQSNLGLALYEAGEREKARVVLQRALALNPRYGKTWNNLGLVCESLGQYEEAEKAYARALSLQPDLAGAYANLGRLKLHLGCDEVAETYLRQALALDSLAVEARINLGLLWQRRGRLEAALAEYRAALAIDPESAEAYNNLGLTYQDLGNLDEAVRAWQRATELRPGYEEAQINLRIAQLRAEGLSRGAIDAQLIKEYPARAELWRAWGEDRAREGDWQEALAAFQVAVRLAPGLPGIYLRLADAHRALGHLEEAIAAYERGLEQGIDLLPLLNNLTSAYAAAGRLKEALQTGKRALELAPDNRRAQENLRELLQAIDRRDPPSLTDE